MSSEQPFQIGQRVIRTGPTVLPYCKKGELYTVKNLKQCPRCGDWKISCEEFPLRTDAIGHPDRCNCGGIIIADGLAYGKAYHYAPVPPAYENISAELAKQGMEVRDRTDVPTIKEPVTN
jgi:hypothetical protein